MSAKKTLPAGFRNALTTTISALRLNYSLDNEEDVVVIDAINIILDEVAKTEEE